LQRNYDSEQRLDVLETALATAISTHGPDGGPTATARAFVASQLEEMGRHAEARLLRRDVVDARRRRLGSEDLSTLISEYNLAYNLYQCRMYEEAEPLSVHVYESRRRILGPDDAETLHANQLLTFIQEESGSGI
jgi:hypothetical protein